MKDAKTRNRKPKTFPAGLHHELAFPGAAMGITSLSVGAFGDLFGLHDLLNPHILARDIGHQVQGYGDI
ncbi:hypothetical protein D3C77_665780 [compost metagenome]